MTTIRNFGHYWSRDIIDWGWKGRPGSLLGAFRPNAEESDADFRNQIGIYVLYDENREAIYVGHRLRQHSRGPMRDRWTAFSWFGFLDVGPDGYLIEREDSAIPAHTHTNALDQFEAILLQVIEPRLAKRGPNWNGTAEYFQFVEEEATTLEHLWHEMQEMKALLGASEPS
jgi:hypothetical protein